MDYCAEASVSTALVFAALNSDYWIDGNDPVQITASLALNCEEILVNKLFHYFPFRYELSMIQRIFFVPIRKVICLIEKAACQDSLRYLWIPGWWTVNQICLLSLRKSTWNENRLFNSFRSHPWSYFSPMYQKITKKSICFDFCIKIQSLFFLSVNAHQESFVMSRTPSYFAA